jgi:predicted RND superfamily exporter protein
LSLATDFRIFRSPFSPGSSGSLSSSAIVQIEQLREEGRPVSEAVIEATEHRMRPIMLTAAAASLALIPIAREIFWGPMAYAMMGGIIVGTLLTLLFLPALYVTWFRIKEPQRATDSIQDDPIVSESPGDLSAETPTQRELENALAPI